MRAYGRDRERGIAQPCTRSAAATPFPDAPLLGQVVARPSMRVFRDGGAIVCERCVLAERPLARAKGLLGRRALPPGEGMLLRPAGSIHTWFMRFPIDVVFVGRDGRVAGIRPRLRPWRMAFQQRARPAPELAAVECERRGLRVGDCVFVLPADAGRSHRYDADRALTR